VHRGWAGLSHPALKSVIFKSNIEETPHGTFLYFLIPEVSSFVTNTKTVYYLSNSF